MCECVDEGNSDANSQCHGVHKQKHYCEINQLVADTARVEMVAVADALPVPRRPRTHTFTYPSLSATE